MQWEDTKESIVKVTKNKDVFISDTASEKFVYQVFLRIGKKWTQSVQN